jgi:hypothetical protein
VLQPDVRFSPDGSMVAVGGEKPTVYDAHTGESVRCASPHSLTSAYVLPNGRELIARRWSPGSNIGASIRAPAGGWEPQVGEGSSP